MEKRYTGLQRTKVSVPGNGGVISGKLNRLPCIGAKESGKEKRKGSGAATGNCKDLDPRGAAQCIRNLRIKKESFSSTKLFRDCGQGKSQRQAGGGGSKMSCPSTSKDTLADGQMNLPLPGGVGDQKYQVILRGEHTGRGKPRVRMRGSLRSRAGRRAPGAYNACRDPDQKRGGERIIDSCETPTDIGEKKEKRACQKGDPRFCIQPKSYVENAAGETRWKESIHPPR